MIGDVVLEARQGRDVVARDVEPGSGVHEVLRVWFDSMWWSWEEVEADVEGDLLIVSTAELLPGDNVYRRDLTVVEVVSTGHIDTCGDEIVKVSYRDHVGVDLWPAQRDVTVIRNASD